MRTDVKQKHAFVEGHEMSGGSNGRHSERAISPKIRAALNSLREAFDYAEDTGSDRWDFAVEIRTFHELGLSETDLRWLTRKGFVEHAREVTLEGDDGRNYRATGELTFCERTCFVLTESGVAQSRSIERNGSSHSEANHGNGNGKQLCNVIPCWDAETKELSLDGEIVKRFKWQAANQEIVLSAFQEENWPARIDDPLPPQPEQDSKRRLSDTIKCLNRKQQNSIIHFRGDGTGEGVIWEFVEPEDR